MKQLTALEIIDETVAFYSADTSRRSVNQGTCVYQNSMGNQCAFGRCMTPEDVIERINDTKPVEELADMGNSIDYLLQDKYQGQTVSFWEDVQRLHDNSNYWGENKISQLGEGAVTHLKKKYSPKTEPHVEN